VHLTGRIGIEGDQVPLEDQRTHPAERLAGPVPVDAVGYGPKTLQRVLRFRRFVTRIDADLQRSRAWLAPLANTPS
jgi:hypothetical protein